MKKLFCILDSLLILSTIANIICYAIFAQKWMSVLTMVFIVVLSGLHLLIVLMQKNKKNLISAVFIIAGILFSVIGNEFIVKNPTLHLALLSLGELSFVAALIFNDKFVVWDIFYMLAAAIPMVLFVNLAPIFGYANAGSRLMMSLVILLMSSILGLSISHLVKKTSVNNIVFTVVSVLNLIYGFGLTILKQSNVTHRITPIVTIYFYVLLLLFSVTILFINRNLQRSKIGNKKNVLNAVGTFMVLMLCCYTISSNFLAYNFVSAKIFKDKFLSMVGNNLNIPIIEVYTEDNAQPQNKTDYVNCSFKISNCESEEFNFSVPMAENYEDEGCVGIRLRGNSTKKARKQPYRIKFDEKKSFFNLKANKSWVLLADYYDQSYIRNYTAFTLANEFEQFDVSEEKDFVPTPHHVALVINNEFKGIYLLCEQMDEKKGRANVDEDFDISIDKEFPFFVEMDLYAYQEGVTGVDNFYVEDAENHVEIKFPEADERGATATSDIVYDYIYEYINAVFKTIKTNEKVEVSFRNTPVGLTDLVDLNSAADYYLINEIMFNIDSAFKSIYFHKTKDGLMKVGPIWDFDFSMTSEYVAPFEKSYIECSDELFIAENSVIFKHLIKNEDFYNLVASRYNTKKGALINTYDHLKDYKTVISPVAKIDAKMWHGTTGEFQFDMQYDYVRLFLMDRYNFLNTAFAKPHSEFLNLI